jgi:hypothetical protein
MPLTPFTFRCASASVGRSRMNSPSTTGTEDAVQEKPAAFMFSFAVCKIVAFTDRKQATEFFEVVQLFGAVGLSSQE